MIFSTDLDHTLIFTERHLRGSAPVTAVEQRLGEPFSYMTPGALALLRRIQKNAVCLVNTLRGYEQAMRVSFVRDASCRYLALQNGLYLYRDGALDMDWASHVARTVRALPIDLDGAVGQVLDGLAGIECLSKRYEYLKMGRRQSASAIPGSTCRCLRYAVTPSRLEKAPSLPCHAPSRFSFLNGPLRLVLRKSSNGFL